MGIKECFVVRLINPPKNYFELFTGWPQVIVSNDNLEKKDFIHFFTIGAKDLFMRMPLLKEEMKSAGMIWVSWPKKKLRYQPSCGGLIRNLQ